MPKKKLRPKTPPTVQKLYKAGLYSTLLESQRRVLDKAGIKHRIPARLPGKKKEG